MSRQEGRLLALEYLSRGAWCVATRSRHPDRLVARAPGYARKHREVRISCGKEIVACWRDGVRVGQRSGKPLERPTICRRCKLRYGQTRGLCKLCARIVSAAKSEPYVHPGDRYHKGAFCVLRRQLVRPLVVDRIDGRTREFEVVYDGT